MIDELMGKDDTILEGGWPGQKLTKIKAPYLLVQKPLGCTFDQNYDIFFNSGGGERCSKNTYTHMM